ncbi:MAG: sensor histidine kinase [Sporichthyaceae bacterium]
MNRRAGTLRARLRLVLAIAAVLFATGAGATLLALESLDEEATQLTDRASPARLQAENLRAAFLDQETGVRGFLISREDALLAPYENGQRAEAAASTAIRDYRVGPGIVAQLDAVSAAAKAWRTEFAEPAIATARATAAAEAPEVDQDEGKALFDVLRVELVNLTEQLGAERASARERLGDGLTRLTVLAFATFALLLVAGVALWLALRRLVLGPVDRLAGETRTVADGEFDHRVEVTGPLEIEALAADVEAMRLRMVSALAASRTAEAEVRAQTVELAEQAEDLRRSNDELEQFAYVASHDLQEPLRKVASFCQMLQRRYSGQLDDRADQYIEFAVDGAKRMQQLINDLLTFSRVGRTSEGMAPVDCSAAAERALSALETARAESGAQVDVGKLPTLQADETLLTQLFQNLVGNAIKFRAPDRPAHVRLEAVREDEVWHFTCTDNGIGIEAEYADRVFVIFQRLHPKDQYQGTGIGLSLCKKIVEYHGGRIWLETDRPEGAVGTVVHWTLPADMPTERAGT